jgi:cytochrome c
MTSARRPLLLALVPVLAALLAAGCQTAPTSEPDQADLAATPVEIQRLARNNDCFKCHALQREKEGPSWHDVAEKYRGKADARDKLYTHLTTAPIIALKGDPEKHKQLKELDPAQIRALVDWILTL